MAAVAAVGNAEEAKEVAAEVAAAVCRVEDLAWVAVVAAAVDCREVEVTALDPEVLEGRAAVAAVVMEAPVMATVRGVKAKADKVLMAAVAWAVVWMAWVVPVVQAAAGKEVGALAVAAPVEELVVVVAVEEAAVAAAVECMRLHLLACKIAICDLPYPLC